MEVYFNILESFCSDEKDRNALFRLSQLIDVGLANSNAQSLNGARFPDDFKELVQNVKSASPAAYDTLHKLFPYCFPSSATLKTRQQRFQEDCNLFEECQGLFLNHVRAFAETLKAWGYVDSKGRLGPLQLSFDSVAVRELVQAYHSRNHSADGTDDHFMIIGLNFTSQHSPDSSGKRRYTFTTKVASHEQLDEALSNSTKANNQLAGAYTACAPDSPLLMAFIIGHDGSFTEQDLEEWLTDLIAVWKKEEFPVICFGCDLESKHAALLIG